MSNYDKEYHGMTPSDVRIDTIRGGQYVHVRAIHLPSGYSAECDRHRSGHRNKREALQALAHKVGPWSWYARFTACVDELHFWAVVSGQVNLGESRD